VASSNRGRLKIGDGKLVLWVVFLALVVQIRASPYNLACYCTEIVYAKGTVLTESVSGWPVQVGVQLP
jgi:hypothetical protein